MVSTHLKNISQNWIISPNRDENKKCLKPPPRICWPSISVKVSCFSLDWGPEMLKIFFWIRKTTLNYPGEMVSVSISAGKRPSQRPMPMPSTYKLSGTLAMKVAKQSESNRNYITKCPYSIPKRSSCMVYFFTYIYQIKIGQMQANRPLY